MPAFWGGGRRLPDPKKQKPNVLEEGTAATPWADALEAELAGRHRAGAAFGHRASILG